MDVIQVQFLKELFVYMYNMYIYKYTYVINKENWLSGL
jgi:hypothetical protein